MVMKGKCIVKTALHDGTPKASDFKIIDKDYDVELADGEILAEAVFISVDPYQKGHSIDADKAVGGFQLSKVIKSSNAKYPIGSLIYSHGGWQLISRLTETDVWNRVDDIEPKINSIHYMGAVGMPGLTAYFGLLEICNPKPGETVMVSTCAGAVGSMVGQIAKIKGCKVIGCCGSDEKIAFAKSIGYDGVFNYKTEKWADALKELAPDGIDCYFDNVGGELSSSVLACMNNCGRIAVCGAISSYAAKETPKADMVQGLMIYKQLRMEGFIVTRFSTVEEKKKKAYQDLVNWISKGDIQCKETMYEGFENIPQAFVDLFMGKNIGKAVVKI